MGRRNTVWMMAHALGAAMLVVGCGGSGGGQDGGAAGATADAHVGVDGGNQVDTGAGGGAGTDAGSAGAGGVVGDAGGCVGDACGAGGSPTYPPEGPLSTYPTPSQPKPGYLQSYIDSTFGTKIIRITDRAAFGLSTDVVRHHYSKDNPWNSDDSLIYIPAGKTLLSDATYKIVGHVSMSGDIRWSNTDPLVMWNVDANARALNKITVHPGTPYTTTKQTLTTLASFDALYFGPSEGNQDGQDKYIAMLGKSGTTATGIVWDLQLNKEVSRLQLPQAFDAIDWISISPSGKYVVVMTNADATYIYNRDFTGYRQLTPGRGHADMGYDASGKEVIVHFEWFNWPVHSQIWSTPLDGSPSTLQFGNALFRDTCQSHISMRALGRPGWVYVSVNNNCTGNNGIEKEVFSIPLDGSGAVAGKERANQWAYTYSSCQSYDRLVFGVPNRDGSKVMFASDWGDTSGEIDSYVAEMP